MKVYIPKLSGFCPGVKTAENNLLNENKSNKLVIIGKLIHNNRYISYLSELGIGTADDYTKIDLGSVIVIRTHGINRFTEKEIRKQHKVLDLTCFKVKNLQNKILEKSKEGFHIIITGKKNHPEVQSLLSYAEHFDVIEDDKVAEIFFSKKKDLFHNKKVFICSQTTSSRSLLEKTAVLARNSLSDSIIEVFDSICSITDQREKQAIELQGKVDATIVLGDKESSNAMKLFNNLLERNENTYFASSTEELLNISKIIGNAESIQIVSSSSTPKFVEDEAINFFESV
ncbi:MAG: 4-hydroxy-3-methylbut-2-enyl diphosphate reductase [Spirochaetes bacterium]|nr:4-hydroxy-3-methylbut-2-enyl diphosphate reductase [Spirochaetota bacterium]